MANPYSGMVLHLIDGTYEIFRHFYGLEVNLELDATDAVERTATRGDLFARCLVEQVQVGEADHAVAEVMDILSLRQQVA